MKTNAKRFGLILTALTVAGLALVLAVLALTEMPVLASPGTTYYVDAALGNDGNTGLAPGAGTAWKTISHAAANAAAGASAADPNTTDCPACAGP